MSARMARPSQYALKFPATNPERMLSEAPPSREAVTTSATCFDLVDVKIFTSSGMTAPANVPHVITVESFHQSDPSPSSWINTYEARYVSATETNDVSQTRRVSGASKSMRSTLSYCALLIASLSRYDAPLAITIRTRIAKIQTRSWTCTTASGMARRMKEMSATP